MSEDPKSAVPFEPPAYVPHAGTVKVSGQTIPRRASACAVHFLAQGLLPVDFLCIGGNAGQQATKAMCLFVFRVKELYATRIAFEPLVFTTMTTDPLSQAMVVKRCTVWRTVVLTDSNKAA